MSRSLSFYTEVIGCKSIAVWDRGAYLQAGGVWLCLSLDQFAASATARDYTHVAFSFDSPGLADFRARLAAAGGREWKSNSSEGESVYFSLGIDS